MSYLVDEGAIRQAVVDKARTQLGKHFGVGGWTPYGQWYGPGWGNAYFCAAGWSWAWYQALGHAEAHRVIGHQTHGGVAPNRRGFVWTVAILVQHRARSVRVKDLKPGDALMFRYNSGDNRQGNEVNHVDLVESNHPDRGYVDCIGFNVPKPGAPAGTDPGRGGGVWRRRIWYSDRSIVTGLRMPVAALADSNRDGWAIVQRHFNELGYGPFAGTGTPGPSTRAAVDQYSKDYGYRGDRDDWVALRAHLEDTLSKIDTLIAEQKRTRADIARVEAAVNAVPANTITRLFRHKLMGFSYDWWIRRGLIPNRDHRHYPADPGSPADIELRVAERQLGEKVEPYQHIPRK